MPRLQHNVFSGNLSFIVGLVGENKHENTKRTLILLIFPASDLCSDSYSVVKICLTAYFQWFKLLSDCKTTLQINKSLKILHAAN